ncbi:uncharacterized protein LOC110198132 [Phascolarctos cinereus]|uniref:Uncharacterized protein LOC110198132 n=1 Tax=Phascolarctos cinereus TaxID=38626 RepID=A0A6P5JA00_PHACI|nr:uncharacterized protein LOC110198132 [Phascolarctos cinereus]
MALLLPGFRPPLAGGGGGGGGPLPPLGSGEVWAAAAAWHRVRSGLPPGRAAAAAAPGLPAPPRGRAALPLLTGPAGSGSRAADPRRGASPRTAPGSAHPLRRPPLPAPGRRPSGGEGGRGLGRTASESADSATRDAPLRRRRPGPCCCCQLVEGGTGHAQTQTTSGGEKRTHQRHFLQQRTVRNDLGGAVRKIALYPFPNPTQTSKSIDSEMSNRNYLNSKIPHSPTMKRGGKVQ